MKKIHGFIFITTNLINGMIYIGQTTKINHSKYLGSGSNLLKVIKIFGEENFKKIILCKCYSQKELDKKETYYILKYNATDNQIGYNIRSGGSHGKHSQQTKDILSIKNLQRCQDPIFIKKLQKANLKAQNRLSTKMKRAKTNICIEVKQRRSEGVKKSKIGLDCSAISKKQWLGKIGMQRKKKLIKENLERNSIIHVYRGYKLYVKNRILITCPHCLLSSKSTINMKRWHFDFCKLKK